MGAMRRLNLRSYFAVLVLGVLLSACSGPAENAGSSNNNTTPAQANNNSAPNAQIAQRDAPAASAQPPTPTVQPIPPPTDKTATARNANAASPTPPANGRAPKLVVPEKKIDYGKQPQGKEMVRAIVIKNGGLADLNIESVVPS